MNTQDIKSKVLAIIQLSGCESIKEHFNIKTDLELADYAISQSQDPINWLIDTNWKLMSDE